MKTCFICRHSERQAIEKAIIERVPYREIGERYGFSTNAVSGHKRHMAEKIAAGQKAIDVSAASVLLEECQAMKRKSLQLMAKAEKAKDIKTAIAALRAQKDIVELLAKVCGELYSVKSINVTMSPQWLSLKKTIVLSLENFPEAREALVAAITQEEADDDTISITT